ncbi:MAG: translation initiation factor IF-2 [Chlamydiae bacterium RIFCSPHIGHO2_02_FULL_49_29]|nr:MAG: translation initiation factor IF-2 [Chlamydiae bacterium GWF2_49_8]OGN57873.1 MAG: translation initiation factor IF-2 [Chlamydiae bacterium RIFCSPHIGHO2_02_FULL_49_29]
MAKNLKLKIKNTQLAAAIKLGKPKKPPISKPEPLEEKPFALAEQEAALPPPKIEPVPPKEAPQEEIAEETAPKPSPPAHTTLVKARPASFIPKPPYQKPKKPEPGKPAAEKAVKPQEVPAAVKEEVGEAGPKGKKFPGFKEYRDIKPRKEISKSSFDGRARQGLQEIDEGGWRKKRPYYKVRHKTPEEEIIRPKELKVRLPITLKDLAQAMKLKASELISKLFMQGVILTLNDYLDDPTTVQLLGQDFGCEITIDTSEEERLKITGKTIKEEIAETSPNDLVLRPPIVTFMGHVDHGKTSLIDAIRKTNIAAKEAGAITQHIGAFKCHTSVGDLTILDTPGHEAFSEMRSRGADVTDIVVLVIAGDEGMRPQTLEAIEQAKAASSPILVAINKCDKPNFNAENVYRQLSEQNLLPEVWGGTTITVNCSAQTQEGIPTLLEMLALQAEVLELRANLHCRARGIVIESQMHKGLGAVATLLVQNGTLHLGDALVLDTFWGRVKTMHDEFGKSLTSASPSYPVKVTGLSDLPEAGNEFIVVSNENEAKSLAEARSQEIEHKELYQSKRNLEKLLQQKAEAAKKKILNIILRTDVQGSLEALKNALSKIPSTKVELNFISCEVGEISEADVQLAATSNAVILGFHTRIEPRSESLLKELKVTVKLHDIIYHVVDEVKELMLALLEKIPQEKEMGKAHVKAVFRSSRLGNIAGCQVDEGTINRSHLIRLFRGSKELWKGELLSLKREKEDIREASKGWECGILFKNWSDVEVNDTLKSYEVTYLNPTLE